MAENSVKELKEYLGTPDRPVSAKEMMDFWKSCSDEEKAEFGAAELN